jgi:hypothetical protein
MLRAATTCADRAKEMLSMPRDVPHHEGATVPKPADRRSEAERSDETVLRVRVLHGDPFRGFVGRAHDKVPLSFNGWIDFMGAVHALLAGDTRVNTT